jgi:hypothetical protein
MFIDYEMEHHEHFYVPYYGMIAKLIDFGYSSVPEAKIISVSEDSSMVRVNRDDDIIYLFRSIYETIQEIGGPAQRIVEDVLSAIDAQSIYKHVSVSQRKQEEANMISVREMLDLFANYKKPVPTENIRAICIWHD